MGSTRREEELVAPTERRVALQADEVEVLLKACLKFRRSLPSYLQVAQPELALIDRIVAKLKDLL